MLIALAIAWRWEWVGGLLFIGLGVSYMVMARGGPWTWSFLLAGPLLVVGALFLVNWRYRGELHHARTELDAKTLRRKGAKDYLTSMWQDPESLSGLHYRGAERASFSLDFSLRLCVFA